MDWKPKSGIMSILDSLQFNSVQSVVSHSATPWIAARQASLSITNSQSSLRLMSIESVMPSSHLILCCPLLLLPPIPPSIMRNAGLEEAQTGIKIAGRNINNLRYADDTTLMAENEDHGIRSHHFVATRCGNSGWLYFWGLDGITDSMDMSLSELQEMVLDREAWRAVIHGVAMSQTWLSDWTELMADLCWGVTENIKIL